MTDEVFFNKMVTKGLEPIESDGRFFEGYLTVQVKDKQGEVTIVDELYKVLPIWMDRGAPITDTHSNRVIGKGINFARSDYTDANGDIYPAIKVTGKIYKDYELDNEIWNKIKSGEYKGLSFGGSTKTDREPMRMKDGSIAYSLSKLEHYEVAVCKDPAVPLAVITDVNPIAKANMNCDHTGCYVTKPILGAPNFEAATRKVMAESNVPKENAKRIVGAAEHKKCDVCGLPKVNKYEERGELGGKESDEDILEMLKNPPKKKPQGIGDIGTVSGKKFTGRLKKPTQGEKIRLGKGILSSTFKNIVSTNKILGLYQGNAIPLARILDKQGGQSHAEQSKDVKQLGHQNDGSHEEGESIGIGRDIKGVKDLFYKQPKTGGAPKIGKGMFDKILKRGRIAGQRIPPSERKPRYGGVDYVKRPKSGKTRGTQNKLDLARHGGENMSLADLTNYIRNIGAAGGDTSQFDAQLARAKERENSKRTDDKKSSLINYIKDAPKDIARPNQTGNVPAGKKKEPKGQSHGAQSTRERERGIIEQQADPKLHYTTPHSMDRNRVTAPSEYLDEHQHDFFDDDYRGYVRGRRPYESMIKPNATLADPRKRKSLFDKIKEDIAKKNYKK